MPDATSDSELSISLRGQLLLATPALSDGTFDHSVILLAEHSSDEGAFGAIINHPSETTVADLVPHLKSTPLASLPVHRGGPLSNEELTFSSLSWKSGSGLSFLPRISAQNAASLVGREGHVIHATVGHSAWTPGQLESELLRNTWITLKPDSSILTHPHDLTLWKRLLSGISPYHALLSQAPANPLLN